MGKLVSLMDIVWAGNNGFLFWGNYETKLQYSVSFCVNFQVLLRVDLSS